MDAYALFFFSSYCFATSLLKCKFCAYVEEFDAAPQSHLSDIYYSAALFWGARQCGKSLEILLLTSCKIEIVKPQTSQNKSLCIFKAVVSGGGGGAIWILSLFRSCNQDCKSSSLNVKRCRVDAILISSSQRLIKVNQKSTLPHFCSRRPAEPLFWWVFWWHVNES